VDVARSKGALVVIAADVMADLDTLPELGNRDKVYRRSMGMALRNLQMARMKDADVIISSDLAGIPALSDKFNLHMYEEGIRSARAMMPRILDILKSKGIR